MVWADFSPNFLLSSDSSVYFNKLQSNTSSGSAHLKSKSQTKNIRTTWNSIDPNGYSMGSKSNMNPNLMKFIKKHPSVHVLRKENIQKNLDVACWNHPNLIPLLYHCVPLFIAILQRFDSTHLNRINETIETISMFRDQTFDSMLKWFTSFIQLIYSAARGRSNIIFPFATFSCSAPSRGLLTLPCNQHGRNVTSSTRVASC